MPFSQDDKALIKNLYLFKGYGSCRLLAKFPEKNWARRGIDLHARLRVRHWDRQRPPVRYAATLWGAGQNEICVRYATVKN